MPDFKIVDTRDADWAEAMKLMAEAITSLRLVIDLQYKMAAVQPEWTVNVAAPEVTVNPDVLPPDVNVQVAAPQVDAPIVNVQIPPEASKSERLDVHRNADGYIDYVTVKEA